MWKELKPLIAGFTAFSLFCSSIYSLNITFLETKKCNKADCSKSSGILSGGIKVSGIKKIRTADGFYLRMPQTKRGRRSYSNIKIISKKLYEYVSETFDLTIGRNEVNIVGIEYKISPLRRLKSDVRVANVDVEFNSQLLVTFGVLKNKKGLYEISLPDNFEFISKKLKEKIEREILKLALNLS